MPSQPAAHDRGRAVDAAARRQLASSPRERRPVTDQPEPAAATRAITAGRRHQGSSLNVPLWGTSTWQTEGLDDTRKRATGMRPGDFYSRYANPTVRAFEDAIAELEGAEDALAFGSGMGADRLDRAGAVLGRRPHRHPAPDLRRHDGVRAGPVRPPRHRAHRRRRHRARRVRRRRAARQDDARDRRDRRPTRGSTSSTSTTSAPSAARSPSSTRRSPRRSASSRCATASTSCCTRRRRASPGTTTPRSA